MNSSILSGIITIRKITLIIFFAICANVYSQTEPTLIDTVQTDTAKFEMQKSSLGAVLRSAIIPGFGQFYNESYWKIPIIWGVLGYLGYQWNDRNNLYKQYRDLYNQSLLESGDGNSLYHKWREDYKDQRDLFAVFIGLTYLLNVLDAYVDAHLFDFDVNEKGGSTYIQLSLKLNF
ncbi:MAG: DUF5683 domain-containing protein [Bacteroidota bacterium]